jgi:hypothetical protein
MTSRTILEKNRRQINLAHAQVKNILPEHFIDLYPNLVIFLEKYYEAQEGIYEIDLLRGGLFALRDLDEINLKFMDRLFYEYGNGAGSEYFQDPAFVGKVIAFLIQNKGNEYSGQLFFRTFFGVSPEIVYPKESILYTFSGNNEDIQQAKIGIEDARFIQDGQKYQILSVLIRSGISFNQWERLYKRFVHPAGFFLSGELSTETVATLGTDRAFGLLNDLGPATITLEENARFNFNGITEATGITDSGDFRFISDLNGLNKFLDIPISYLDTTYKTIRSISDINSPTMDQDENNPDEIILTDQSLETMDATRYIRFYHKDSA